jgi:hypothetical protein
MSPLSAGEQVVHEIPVDGSIQSLRVGFGFRPSSEGLSAQIILPSGENLVLTRDAEGLAYSWVGRPAETGFWVLKAETDRDGHVIGEIRAVSDLKLHIDAPQGEHISGQEFRIEGWLMEGTAPVSGAQVAATVQDLDEGDVSLDVTELGGGRYSALFERPPPGDYLATFTASGRRGTQPFRRIARLPSLFVAPRLGELLGVVGERAIDEDGDGWYESLDLDLEFRINESGPCVIGGELVSEDGELISQAFDAAKVDKGTLYTTLSFRGDAIRRSGNSGRFTLTNLTVRDEWRTPLIERMEGEVYRTAAYQSEEFK